MRSILKAATKALGFEATEAGNGKEGLAKLAESDAYELILVDWNMPVMNGVEFITAARAKGATMKIVMVTTEVEMTQVAMALAAGADEYVMKPFTNEILREKLSMLGLCAA